ncbi:unnamed protein product [Prunus armeniaca]|uniref:Uncharacterized protein n=1 Tax=Prunus armeniaca TaxID=36596 RepID=A0A6J5TML8_PRUAR|nr:unnamed protein product [Prunus armeniaca]
MNKWGIIEIELRNVLKRATLYATHPKDRSQLHNEFSRKLENFGAECWNSPLLLNFSATRTGKAVGRRSKGCRCGESCRRR